MQRRLQIQISNHTPKLLQAPLPAEDPFGILVENDRMIPAEAAAGQH